MQNALSDRFLYWPITIAVCCPLACVLGWAGPFIVHALFVPMVVLSWAVAGAIGFIVCVTAIGERKWRRFWSSLVLPATVLAAAAGSGAVWPVVETAGDYVHLFAMYPYYRSEISKHSADQPRFLLWQWDGGTPCSTGIAYDESGDVLSRLLFDARKERAERPGDVAVYGDARAIGHFYFVHIC